MAPAEGVSVARRQDVDQEADDQDRPGRAERDRHPAIDPLGVCREARPDDAGPGGDRDRDPARGLADRVLEMVDPGDLVAIEQPT